MKNGGGNRFMARKIPFIGKEMIRFPAPWLGEGQFEDVCAYFEPVDQEAELKVEIHNTAHLSESWMNISTLAPMPR